VHLDTRRQNHLLALLQRPAYEFAMEHALIRGLRHGEIIFEKGEPLTHAVFPVSGQISLMAVRDDGRVAEKMAIGPEGMLGLRFFLGGGIAKSHSVVRIPGEAVWLPMTAIQTMLERFPCLRTIMLHYGNAMIAQLLESAACNSLCLAPERVARWLLHAHDSVHGDSIQITQESLAEALGLRRATVNSACLELGKAGIIDYSRGKLIICDREKLEDRASQAYANIRSAFAWQSQMKPPVLPDSHHQALYQALPPG
jgi:CRP-like cAMP-binding protein